MKYLVQEKTITVITCFQTEILCVSVLLNVWYVMVATGICMNLWEPMQTEELLSDDHSDNCLLW